MKHTRDPAAAQRAKLKQSILELVRTKDHVTFAELRSLDGFAGDCEIRRDDLNIILWQRMSVAAIDAIEELRQKKLIYYAPCSPLTYFIDGAALRLPVVKGRPPKGGYKKTRWLPTVLRLTVGEQP